jgi:hypothetical protein
VALSVEVVNFMKENLRKGTKVRIIRLSDRVHKSDMCELVPKGSIGVIQGITWSGIVIASFVGTDGSPVKICLFPEYDDFETLIKWGSEHAILQTSS